MVSIITMRRVCVCVCAYCYYIFAVWWRRPAAGGTRLQQPVTRVRAHVSDSGEIDRDKQ